MSITSSRRNALREELLAFNREAQEVRDRFHWFLEKHDPRGYADYSIFPFDYSKSALDSTYFNVDVEDKFLASVDHFVEDDDPMKNSLLFKGPDSKHEIASTAFAYSLGGGQNDEYPTIYKLQNPWNVNKLYIRVPDEYIDDPERWEARVLDSLESDRANAHQVLVHLFGSVNVDVLTYKTALIPYFEKEYVEVHLDRESLAAGHWAVLKGAGMDTDAVPVEELDEGETNAVIITFSQTQGSVFLGTAPHKHYTDPAESDSYMGNIVLNR